jgi:hypothetical protein
MKDGCTKREHYEAAGIPRDQWGIPEFPEGLEHLWHWFLRLNGKRQSGMAANAIPFSEYKSFFEIEGVTPEHWEVAALERLDAIAMEQNDGA